MGRVQEAPAHDRGDRLIYLLSAGHLFTDMNQGALPAILPFLIAQRGFDYTTAAGLVFALTLISSVVQPLFGVMADKISKPWVMPAGVFLAGGGIAATGFFSDYPLLFGCVLISGVGVAAYHPEAARFTNMLAGRRKATGLSIFSFGGNIGFALGPMVVTSLILSFGLGGVSLLFLPAAAIAAVLMSRLPALHEAQSGIRSEKIQGGARKKDHWGGFALLCTLLFSRAFIFYGMNTFIPLYWIHVFHQEEATANMALSLLLAVGACSTLIGGRLGDRYGFIPTIRAGFILLLPLLWLFASTTNAAAATLLLIPVGFALYLPLSSMVVMGQKYLPGRIGLASGVTLGLAVSVGGLAAPILGRVADIHGLHPIMYIVAAVAVLPTFLAWTLPKLHEDTGE